MLGLIATFHILGALILIALVLLQDSKGGAMGMLSGGGSNSVFGSTGAENFLVKATRYTALFFAATSILLAYLASKKPDSVLDDYVPPPKAAAPKEAGASATDAAPASKTAQPQSDAKAPQ